MKKSLVLSIAATTALIAVSTSMAGATQPACEDATTEVFASGLPQPENLAFDGEGHLYVSSVGGKLYRFTPDGTAPEVLVDGDSPLGGLALDDAGRLYLGVGVGLATPVPAPAGTPFLVQSGAAQVWRFNTLFPPSHEVYVDELDSANGMEIDRAGNLYISEGFDLPILRVPPDGEPEVWTDALTPNGLRLTPDGQALYVAQTFDPLSRIKRITLADPSQRTTVASLSGPPALPKGLDDLGVGPDGSVYVTGHVSNEVLRVHPDTGEACVVATIEQASAALIANGFGDYDGDLFVTGFDGNVTVVRL